MPRLLSENKETDTDDTSRVSECSRSLGNDEHSIQSSPSKTAESAANKLLSLAAVAENHAKSDYDDAPKTEQELDDNDTIASHPTSPSGNPNTQSSFDASRQPIAHGMSPRWLPPHMRGAGTPMNGFYGPGVMRPIYPAGASPGGSPPGDPRFLRQGGGFPMWSSPRPPYHPHAAQMRGPSPMHPAYRGPVASPIYTAPVPSSQEEDDGSVNSRKRSAPKRVSLGPATKSILKKPRGGDPPGCNSKSLSDSTEKSATDKQDDGAKITGDREDAALATDEKKAKDSSVKSVVVEKESLSSEDPVTKKQRIISPASSNECHKSNEEDDPSSPPQQQRQMSTPHSASPSPAQFHPSPFGMGHPMHRGPPYAPPAMYPPHGVRPFPIGMHPMGGPAMFHRNMSARGRPGFPPMGHFYGRARMPASPSPSSMMMAAAGRNPSPAVTPSSNGEDQQQQGVTPAPTTSSTAPHNNGRPVHRSGVNDFSIHEDPHSAKRCIPIDPSIPSKQWSDEDSKKDVHLPDFHRLVNFPDHLIKSRMLGVDGSSCKGGSNGANNGPATADGKKRCVMCGQLRISATYVRAKRGTPPPAAGDNHKDAAEDNDGPSSHIIPRQNKGVCTACDVTVWVALELDGLEIKWCKGCKNFRPWTAFGCKGSATKCVRCRDRQKEKYAMQKANVGGGRQQRNSSSDSKDTDEARTTEESAAPCNLALAAANGLRSMMMNTAS